MKIIKTVVNVIGIALARSPKIIPATLSIIAGSIVYYLLTSRRRLILSNLHHAFPQKTERWRRKIARISCIRMIEMALFLVASPHFSKKRAKKTVTLMPSFHELAEEKNANERPDILLLTHLSLTESLNLYPIHYKGPQPKTGVIYRPLDVPALEEWVKETRGRFGLTLLSRKKGFYEAMDILKNNGIVGILFDQNGGSPGALTLFFDRLASTTELPDILAKKYKPHVSVMYPERTGFWKAKLHIEKLSQHTEETPIAVTANAWLEKKLKENDQYCENWLWFHNRWRHQDNPHWRFKIQAKRNLLKESLTFNGLSEVPKKTRYWFRLPNWLGDVMMALPLIKAVRKSRPDAEITLLAQEGFIPLLQTLNVADRIIGLPKKGWNYYLNILKYRKEYPDVHFLFTNSARGDLEAYLIGVPQRFGMQRPSKRKRKLLTDLWEKPIEVDETKAHQTHVWEQCFRYFGLEGEIDCSSFEMPAKKPGGKKVIGMIAGTENDPSKRWPIEHWRKLIALILDHIDNVEIRLFGTSRDKEITKAISEKFDSANIHNLAGKTNLTEFAEELSRCDVVVCNDTGGMHLANAIGIPVIAIFGPTNPIRTGPIYNGRKIILQPEGCPPTGGYTIKSILPLKVYQSLNDCIASIPDEESVPCV